MGDQLGADVNWDLEIDAIGLLCPLPVLKLQKAMRDLKRGQILRLLASDPAAVIDVPHYCHASSNRLLSQEKCETHNVYLICKS